MKSVKILHEKEVILYWMSKIQTPELWTRSIKKLLDTMMILWWLPKPLKLFIKYVTLKTDLITKDFIMSSYFLWTSLIILLPDIWQITHNWSCRSFCFGYFWYFWHMTYLNHLSISQGYFGYFWYSNHYINHHSVAPKKYKKFAPVSPPPR